MLAATTHEYSGEYVLYPFPTAQAAVVGNALHELCPHWPWPC
jgi:hypothetical protein